MILNEISAKIKNNKELCEVLKQHYIDLESMNINSCLINQYRNGDDSIRAHRDTYLSFGKHPIIIGISMGDSRILRVRKLHNPEIFKSLKVEKLTMKILTFFKDNSLFIMAGYSQTYFSHEVPKMSDKDMRYSLTFLFKECCV